MRMGGFEFRNNPLASDLSVLTDENDLLIYYHCNGKSKNVRMRWHARELLVITMTDFEELFELLLTLSQTLQRGMFK